MLTVGRFPAPLKETRVSPVFKKKNPFDVQTYSLLWIVAYFYFYRPISILPIISKLFSVLLKSSSVNILKKKQKTSISLSAFRKGFSCQSVLLDITEEWRNALDRNEYVAAILMDLAKAFACLPSDLITEKLRAYRLQTMS